MDLSGARKPLGGVSVGQGFESLPSARPGSARAGLWLLQRWQGASLASRTCERPLGPASRRLGCPGPNGARSRRVASRRLFRRSGPRVLCAGEAGEPGLHGPSSWVVARYYGVFNAARHGPMGVWRRRKRCLPLHVGLDAHPPPPARQARRALCGRYWGSGPDAVGVVSRRGRRRCSSARARSSPTARESGCDRRRRRRACARRRGRPPSGTRARLRGLRTGGSRRG